MLRTLSLRDFNTPSHSIKKFCLYSIRHRMGLEPRLPTHKLWPYEMVSYCFGILHWHATDSLYARLQHSKSLHKRVLPVLCKTELALSHICQLTSCDHRKWYHI